MYSIDDLAGGVHVNPGEKSEPSHDRDTNTKISTPLVPGSLWFHKTHKRYCVILQDNFPVQFYAQVRDSQSGAVWEVNKNLLEKRDNLTR